MAKRIRLPECARELLETLYPSVDWDRVEFYEGLPWYTNVFNTIGSWFGALQTAAITLPDPVGFSAFRIYFAKPVDFCDPKFIATLVHEAYHVAQFMSVGGGYGFGMWRAGFIQYFVCFFQHGAKYDNNPFEKEAYAHERAFLACHRTPICRCPPHPPDFDRGALADLIACNKALIVREPRIPVCAGFFASIFGAILTATIAGVAFLAHILELLNCRRHLVGRLECARWGVFARRECEQWADQGYEQCDKWADEGTTQCTQWQTTASSMCCDWVPCKWLCKLIILIYTTVCVLTVWVSKGVCKLTIWVTKLVCIVWVTIAEVICFVWSLVFYIILLCWI
jgi:hypothetical protein